MPSSAVVPEPRAQDVGKAKMKVSVRAEGHKKELFLQLQALNVQLSQDDEDSTWRERVTYSIEKWLSFSDLSLYYILGVTVLLLTLILGLLWSWSTSKTFISDGSRRLPSSAGSSQVAVACESAPEEEYTDFGMFAKSVFIAFQVILSAGFDSSINTPLAAVVYSIMIFVGLIVFGTLIGMITESFESLIDSIRSGELKAVERKHTLLLGWNEGTVRLICQIAFLRRQFQQLNEQDGRKWLWWRRLPASTSVAENVIIVMCKDKEKDEMEEAIRHAFAERGISNGRTRLGCDVVCRKGDPSDVQSLQRVGAQHAHAIVVQAMDGVDSYSQEGVTIRTLMALRFVLYTARVEPSWGDMRIIVEMTRPSKVVTAAQFTAPDGQETIVYPQDLSIFLNSLLFACLGQPGLAQVQLDLMNFESAAIKFRKASLLRKTCDWELVGSTVAEASLLWEDAVFLGVQQASSVESGLLPDPSYVIQADDTVIFLCNSSMPNKALGKAGMPEPLGSPPPLKQEPRLSGAGAADLHVLICGWRDDWDKPELLLQIFDEIAHDVRTNMLLHFVCNKEEQDFQYEMQLVMGLPKNAGRVKEITGEEKGAGQPAWELNEKCKIAHTYWDCCTFDDLEEVVKTREYHEAIIIPWLRPEDKNDEDDIQKILGLKDTWVMSTMLMLKQFQRECNQMQMHIIAENSLDATSKLSVTQGISNKSAAECLCPTQSVATDFVNTLAIRARALAQVAAYPRMGTVLNDLYSKADGTPIMMLVDVRTFGLQRRSMTFGQATKLVQNMQPNSGGPCDVVLGIRSADGNIMMPPNQSQQYMYGEGDMLIIITKRASTPAKYERVMLRHARTSGWGAEDL